jgi:GTP pyrophosphokinase
MDYKPMIDQAAEELLHVCRNSSIPIEIEKVDGAIRMACSVLGLKSWESGVPIVLHSIAVAKIVAVEIGLGTNPIVAALLHNVLESSDEKDSEINVIPKQFGNVVSELLAGLFKINSIDTVTISVHSENFRRLMLTMSGDIRVILIKIADRLMDMRNLEGLPSELQQKYAQESSYLYAPLAHRLGLYSIKTELEDLSLKYMRPDDYRLIVQRLEETKEERAKFVSEFVKPIEEKLKTRQFKFEMKARTKSIYSIWNKMKNQKVSFDEVYDLFAIRVILDSELESEKSDCWQVYSIVTEEYQPNTERRRDWISIPKSNGYESLHTTVMGPHGRWVEIQIRTRRMDEVAEKVWLLIGNTKGEKAPGSSTDGWQISVKCLKILPAMQPKSSTNLKPTHRTTKYSCLRPKAT